jgi:hypothetical protein
LSKSQPTPDSFVRRDRDTLYVIGTGILALGAWALVKYVMMYLRYSEQLTEAIGKGGEAGAVVSAVLGILIGLALFELVLHVIVGLSARAEGQGKRKGFLYLACAVLLALLVFAYVCLDVFGLVAVGEIGDKIDIVIEGVIDFTSFVMLAGLIAATVRLRKSEPESKE